MSRDLLALVSFLSLQIEGAANHIGAMSGFEGVNTADNCMTNP